MALQLKLWLFISFFAFPIKAFAQTPPEQFFFHLKTTEDGLSQTNNSFWFKDSRGFIWISSTSGLNRYDGSEIITFEPDSSDPNALFGQNIQGQFGEDSDNNLWFCTADGINRFVRQTGAFEHFFINISEKDVRGSYFSSGLDLQGRLWVIVNDSLFHFDINTYRSKFVHKLPKETNRGRFFLDKDGIDKWFLSYTKGRPSVYITSYNGRETTQKDFFLYGSNAFPKLKVFDVAISKTGEIWLATDKGLLEWHYPAEDYSLYSRKNNILIYKLASIEWFKNHYLAVAASNQGLLLFNLSEKKYSHQFLPNTKDRYSLASMTIDDIFVDPDNDIWLNYNFIGFNHTSPFKPKFGKYFSGNDSLQPLAFSAMVEGKDGSVYAGTHRNGVKVINSKKEIERTLEDSGHPEFSTATTQHIVMDSEDRFWFLTWSGLFLHSPSVGLKKLSNDIFLFGLLSRNGEIILSGLTPSGLQLATYSDNSGLVLTDLQSKIDSPHYTFLHERSDGLIYACEDANSMVLLDPASGYETIKRFSINGDIRCIYEMENEPITWVASTYGLNRLNLETGEIKTFTKKDGLPNAHIYSILPDSHDAFWLSTNRGIVRVNPKDFENVESFGLADGISGLEFNSFSYLKKRNGEFWFGSTTGLTTFFPDQIKSKLPLASPQITNILVNDEPWPMLVCQDSKATNPEEIKKIVLKYVRNTLSFEFKSLEYSDPDNNQLKYKMVGVDDKWIYTGSKAFARYANMRPGQYQFIIKAANSDGMWNNNAPSSLIISILPPYYLSWWFILSCLAGIVSISWYSGNLYRKRKEKVLQLQLDAEMAGLEERLRISRDMHDQLGANLKALVLKIARIQLKYNKGVHKTDLDSVQETAKQISQNVRESIWIENTENDTLDNLIYYLYQQAKDLFEHSDTDLHFLLPELPPHSISGTHRRHILFTFKEALINIHKHAEANQVIIRIEFLDDAVRLVITDNGKGFGKQPPKPGTGNGLKNMESRMSNIGGSFEISEETKGTRVALTFKI
ncbi:MAG: triple tyrosine motif-containing protein [Bacteroidota bacterium]